MASKPSQASRIIVKRYAIARNILLFFGFLAAAAYILILEGVLPTADPLKQEAGVSERFWQLKVRGHRQANVVVLGDSRVNKAVSPEVLTDQFSGKGWNALNLGFRWGGLNPGIYEFAETRIDFSSPQPPMVILGVSPGSLTLERTSNRHFRHLMNRSRILAYAYIWFPRITGMLFSGEVDAEIRQYPGQTEYHDNGWQAGLRENTPWADAWFEVYRDSDRINPETWSDLMEQTRRWRGRDIRVFAFRPPTSPDLREIEDSRTGFDTDRFSREFEANGGEWIEIEASGYRTYDNSHLAREEAVRFSRELGRKIAANLSDTGPAPGSDSE